MAACRALPSLYLSQKETKRGSVHVLCIYVKHHVENDSIPCFPSLHWSTANQQMLQTISQSPGFLIHTPSTPRRKTLYIVECWGPEHSCRQDVVLCA